MVFSVFFALAEWNANLSFVLDACARCKTTEKKRQTKHYFKHDQPRAGLRFLIKRMMGITFYQHASPFFSCGSEVKKAPTLIFNNQIRLARRLSKNFKRTRFGNPLTTR